MPSPRAIEEAGFILEPAELEMLGRVFEMTGVAGEDEHARELRASRIIGYFLAGITSEEELCMWAKRPLHWK